MLIHHRRRQAKGRLSIHRISSDTTIAEDLSIRLLAEDIVFCRHWCPESETYAGGDQLATLLFMGWQIREIICQEKLPYLEKCAGRFYHVILKRREETLVLPVLANPYVERIVAGHKHTHRNDSLGM
ncbi:MAG: hypothetical protein SF029_08550 [bacterium]|nr:hypothetical protein [bacterium]